MKKNRSIIITIIILVCGIGWLCYPIFPWEDTYSEYQLGDMKSYYSSPYKEQFDENQNISQFGSNNGDYELVYLMANGKDIYYITETPDGMGKELYNLNGDMVTKLYEGTFNTLCGVKITDNKLYYVYGNIHGRSALGYFVKGAVTVEADGKKKLFSTAIVFKPNFAVYNLSNNTVSKISKSHYIDTINLHH